MNDPDTNLQNPLPAHPSGSTCAAITSRGTSCQRPVKAGEKQCWQHSHGLGQKWRSLTRNQSIVLVCALIGVIGVLITLLAWRFPEFWKPNLEIYYHGQKLDEQSVTLAKSCIPASSIQPDMCIDQNYPNNFELFAMAMLADSSIEAHDVLLDFSTKVTVPSPSWSCWKPVNAEGTEFSCFLNKQIVPAQLPVGIEPFVGTPLPSPEMDVTVRVFYGSKMTRAMFALRTPN